EELGLARERGAQVLVELRFGEQLRIGRDSHETAQLEPLRGEIFHQRLRPLVGQHAPDLPLQHDRLAELPAPREVEELIVRNAAPEKEREPRGELYVAQTIR